MAHLSPHLTPVSVCEGEEVEVISPSLEPFDIEDFTAASDWEKFVAQVEEAVRGWGLAGKGEDEGGETVKVEDKEGWLWRQKVKKVAFMGTEFNLTRHRLVDPNEATKEKKPTTQTSSSEVEEDDDYDLNDPMSSLPLPLKEMMHPGRDFPSLSHPVHYFFGFTDFLLLTPLGGHSDLDDPSKVKAALSAARVSAGDTSCRIPVLLQVRGGL